MIFIYLISDNFLLKKYVIPYVFVFIKDRIGHQLTAEWIVVLGLLLFAVSALLSFIYKAVVGKLTAALSAVICDKSGRIIDKVYSKSLSA